MTGTKFVLTTAVLGAAVAIAAPQRAEACGCFAPPSVGEPVIQAGERIVFAHEDGEVVAHIQIQYQGEASDFAWLLPLPAEPQFELGTEEIFTRLDDTTRPRFQLNRSPGDGCGNSSASFGCSESADFASGAIPPQAPPPDPVLVAASSAGPYDYAVLRADSKQPMLDWLQTNGYFVPAGTQDAVGAYIHPGAYLLALKLGAGQDTGDLQPVIIRYPSELPMIPIILTSVGATPNMGILVYVLGDSRAIPQNYQHVQINEQYINWQDEASNYASVVTRAIDEAEGHHAFVTEFAGSTAPMVGVLDPPGRFGRRSTFEAITDPSTYVSDLVSAGFWWPSVLPTLQRTFPFPEQARRDGITERAFYANLATFLDRYPPESFDPLALTAELWERVVVPTVQAGELFRRHPKMTRMYTTLSPDEMTKDPVFSFNPDLADVSNFHVASVVNHCEGDLLASLTLADGRMFHYESEAEIGRQSSSNSPFAARIEVMRLEGDPMVVVDNTDKLRSDDDLQDGGCISSGRPRSGGFGVAVLFGLIWIGRSVLRRRHR